jgi:GH15 family glucan-1,4-alpha-glucosidase
MAADVAGHALLSDCQTAALVDDRGTVDWWPGPRFDGPSVFASLLDDEAGHWTICPAGEFTSERRYLEDTMVVQTDMRTAGGVLRVTDCLAFAPGARGHQIGRDLPHALVRVAEALEGTVTVEVRLRPRPEYGLAVPRLQAHPSGLSTVGGSERLFLSGTLTLEVEGTEAHGTTELGAGERFGLVLARRPGMHAEPPAPLDPFAALQDTVAGWRSWAERHRPQTADPAGLVGRSLLVLQALTYQPSGALVAAPTTSLPERPGEDANWDYRYAWLRDAALTARALRRSACSDEAARYFRWMTRAALTCESADNVQIVYGVEGERALHERELDHLDGFAGSRPVRIGNAAWRQVQLDVLGEVIDVACQLRDDDEAWEPGAEAFVRSLVDRAAQEWRRPDAGIWEGREGDRHFTSSKLMCWVALDRGVRLAARLGAQDRAGAWASERDELRAAILEQAWCEERGAFAGAFGSDHLDVSVLLMPLVGFLDAGDERMVATADALEAELGEGGLLRRWTGAQDGAFLLASYWLAEVRAQAGDVDRAEAVFARATACANDLGLLAEEADPATGAPRGNFPQGLSHMGLINAASAIEEARTPPPRRTSGRYGSGRIWRTFAGLGRRSRCR